MQEIVKFPEQEEYQSYMQLRNLMQWIEQCQSA